MQQGKVVADPFEARLLLSPINLEMTWCECLLGFNLGSHRQCKGKGGTEEACGAVVGNAQQFEGDTPDAHHQTCKY